MVTSARENLTDEQLANHPESGNVFIINDVPVKGVPVNSARFDF
jgi:hypothetical protein